MVQMLSLPILLSFLLILPSFAAPLPVEDITDIDLREPASNELVSRKIHIHLPKVHLPHIDSSKVLDGLRKWAPKIGKAVFKIATKLILREEATTGGLEARSGLPLDLDSILAVSERGIDEEDGIEELFARAPKKKTLKKLLKAAKKMKKYAKKYAKQELKDAVASSADNAVEYEGDFVRRSELDSPNVDIDSRDEEVWEYGLVAKELDDADVDVRELDLYLDVLVRGLEGLVVEPVERDDWSVYGHW